MELDYKNHTADYSTSGEIIPADCGAIEFFCDDVSTVDAFINGRRIAVGTSWSPSDQRHERDKSKYTFTFDITGTCLLVVTRKKYL